jgi:hypothetical protein
MSEANARATKNMGRLKPPKMKARNRPISTMAPEMPLVMERTGFRMMFFSFLQLKAQFIPCFSMCDFSSMLAHEAGDELRSLPFVG